MSLTLIATSDLHGALPAELSRQLASAPGPTVYVDNGDLFGGPSQLSRSLHGGGCAQVEALADLGLAALNLGNHDLDDGVDGLLSRVRQAPFPVLCGNLFDGAQPLLTDRAELDTPAGRVGVAGALTPLAPDMWAPGLRARLRMTDPVVALRASCAALHLHCRYVVALAHFGLPVGPEPAAENPGEALLEALGADAGDGRPLADVVVLGHTHVPHAGVRDRTAVLSPASGGRGLGRAVLDDGVSAELVDLDPAPDPGWQARFAPLLAEPLALPGARFAEQLLYAAGRAGADGLVVTRRLQPQGAPVATLGEALQRAPLLEPLVLLELDGAGLADAKARSAEHAALAREAADEQVARRHRWHAFEVLLGAQTSPPWRLFVPASWSGGYGGYDVFSRARLIADEGAHLVQLLRRLSRSGPGHAR